MGVSLDTASLQNSDQGSSISTLLSILTGHPIPPVSVASNVGTNLPPAQAAPLPQMNAATAQSLLGGGAPGAQPPGMIHRIVSNLLGVPGAINRAANPFPAEYQAAVDAGLISPQEAEAARPSAWRMFDPDASYQGNLDKMLAMQKTVRDIAEQQRIMANRRSIEARFPLKANATDEDIRSNMLQKIDALIGTGDLEAAKEIGGNLRGFLASPRTPSTLHEVPGVGLVDMTDPMRPRVAVPVQPPEKQPHVVNAQEGVFEMRPDGLYDVATGQKYTRGTVHPVAMQPSFTPVTISPTPGAPPVVVPFSSRTGGVGAPVGAAPPKTGSGLGGLAAPMAAKVGQFGEMLKKADDLLPSMEALDVSLGQSAAQDVALHGVGVGSARIPGTQGLGSALVNRIPDYSRYQAALSPFILAAAHALSGARINKDQVDQIKQSIEIKPGDTQSVRDQKRKNVIDLINSIGGSLPPDAVQGQESQLSENSLTRLQGLGYRPSATSVPTPSTGAPTGRYSPNNPFAKKKP